MNGNRSAATTGDRIALRIAITAAAISASKNVWTATWGTISAATNTAVADTSQAIAIRTGENRGVSGLQVTASPYVGASSC